MNLIPQAMLWKYGVKCGKTPAGDDIAIWESTTIPQPSKAQIVIDVAEYEAYLISDKYIEDKEITFTKKDRLLFEMNFGQENKIRILEGKAAITKQQYKNAIVALYKTL